MYVRRPGEIRSHNNALQVFVMVDKLNLLIFNVIGYIERNYRWRKSKMNYGTFGCVE